jgi:hypothetical protein
MIKKCSLSLNKNGSSFSCRVWKDGLPKEMITELENLLILEMLDYMYMDICMHNGAAAFEYIHSFEEDASGKRKPITKRVELKQNAHLIPPVILEAIACSSRAEVKTYLEKGFLSDDNKLIVKAAYRHGSDQTFYMSGDIQINLTHTDFRERKTKYNFFQHHPQSISKTRGHTDSPSEMLEFVINREAFFQDNYKQGKDYAEMSVFNPFWLIVLCHYYFESSYNYLTPNLLAQSLGMQPTHFCEDFDRGYEENKPAARMI